jgi:hypothetical protein
MANYSFNPQAPQFPSQGMQFPTFGAPPATGDAAGAAMNTFGQNFGSTQSQQFNPIGMMGTSGNVSMNGQGGGIPTWGVGTQGAGGGFFANSGLGMNMPTLQLGMQGLGSLANLWMGAKSVNLARDQFNLTKDVTNTNLNNSLKAYNSTLDDRLRTRGQFNGDDPSKAQAEYERKKLTR